MTSRTLRHILLFTLAAVATLGCRADNPNDDVSAGGVQSESQDAVQAAQDHVSEEMKAFIHDNEQRVAELEEKAKVWRTKVDGLSEDTRAAAREELAEIETKVAEVRRQLKMLKEAADAAREDLKTGAEAALDNLRKAYDRAASRF